MKEIQLDGKEAFATNLKRLRKEKRMSQIDLANKSGLTQSGLSQLENGIYWPDYNTVDQLAKALSCEHTDLFKKTKLK